MSYQLKQIPSETEIKRIIKQVVFGRKLYCPCCHSDLVVPYETRYRCKKCRKKFTLINHTWLKDMKLSWEEFYLILWCYVTKVPLLQAVALSKLPEKTIIHWYDKFREQLLRFLEKQAHLTLEGNIQMDEAYFGHFEQCQCLLMAKQTTGKPRLVFELLPPGIEPTKTHVIEFAKTHLVPGSTLNTDGSSIYSNIEKYWPLVHGVNIHDKFEFDLTSQIEGTFGNLRTFIRRMYYHPSSTKLGSLIAEFTCRFNHPEIFKNPRSFLEFTLHLVPSR